MYETSENVTQAFPGYNLGKRGMGGFSKQIDTLLIINGFSFHN